MPFDKRLEMMVDLHGLSVIEAERVVNSMLSASASRGIKKFRFVTGRGNHINAKGERGTLHKSFLAWIEQSPFKERVEQCAQYDGYYEITCQSTQNQKSSGINAFESMFESWMTDNLETIKKDAEEGDVHIQTLYAQLLENCVGTEEAFKQAAEFYRKAADKNHLPAMNELARCYAHGRGLRKNESRAFHWLQKADQLGYIEATVNLGDCYWFSYGEVDDPTIAVSYYKKAAEHQHPTAMRRLASAYNQGVGVSKDSEEAFKWYKRAADLGDVIAQYNVGVMYQDGMGTEVNLKEAWRYLYRAAEGDDPEAQCAMGFHYLQGTLVEKDESLGLMWLKKAATNGSKPAIHELSLIPDKASKATYLKQSAAIGNIFAKLELASDDGTLKDGAKERRLEFLAQQLMHLYALPVENICELDDHTKFLLIDLMLLSGTKKEKQKAFKAIERMSEKKCILSLRRLFFFYHKMWESPDIIAIRKGLHIIPNIEKALKYLQAAVDLGDSKSILVLGYFHEHGKDVAQSNQMAVSYYRKAAEQYHPTAYFNIALCCYRGWIEGEGLKKAQRYAELAIALEQKPETPIPLSSGILDEYESIEEQAAELLKQLLTIASQKESANNASIQALPKDKAKELKVCFDQHKKQADNFFKDKRYQEAYQEWTLAINMIDQLALTIAEKQEARAILYNNLGVCCRELEKYAQAIAHFQQSLENRDQVSEGYKKILQKKVVCENKLTSDKNNKSAVALYDQDKWQEALFLFQSVLKANQNLFGDKPHKDIAEAYWNMSLCYLKLNQLEQAELAATKAYELYKNLLGEHHDQTQKALMGLKEIKQLIHPPENSHRSFLASAP